MSSSKGSAIRKPKGWPEDITYLDSPRFSSNVITHRCYSKVDQLRPNETVISGIPKGPSPNVRITTISDKSHPACGQRGLFTAQHLEPNSFILCYIGYVHGREDSDARSDYDLSLDRDLEIGVDASIMGNEARFINDYRGIGSGPNAEFREIWIDIGHGRVEKRMGVYVLTAGKSGKRAKGISKGQEILVSYGKGFWIERAKEHNEANSTSA